MYGDATNTALTMSITTCMPLKHRRGMMALFNLLITLTHRKKILHYFIFCCFLAPLAIASLCHGLLSVMHPSVCPCVNFFFKHLLLWNYLSDFDEISQKCSCHGPLQNFLKKFDSIKNCGCHGNKTEKNLKTLKIFLSETIRVRATKLVCSFT